jgi:hypothetical protein
MAVYIFGERKIHQRTLGLSWEVLTRCKSLLLHEYVWDTYIGQHTSECILVYELSINQVCKTGKNEIIKYVNFTGVYHPDLMLFLPQSNFYSKNCYGIG